MRKNALVLAEDSWVREKSRTVLLSALAALLIGFCHLLWTIGPGIVFASHPYWRFPAEDIAINVLGAEAFFRDPHWHFPLAVTSGLVSAGQPVSIVFTDSTPWIAILVKALHLNNLSVMGLTAALSIVLQPVAFVLLLLALGVRRPESLAAGTLLGSLLPAWYMRLGMHIALASHWLIVLALALAVAAIRKGVTWRIMIALAALGALTFGIHPYLFVMVTMIAGGALLADVARSGMKEAPKAAAGIALFAACSAASAWMLVYGPSSGAHGFGHYSMNLVSPVFPQRSGIAAILTGHSGRIIDGTSGQYEGFNYLGAGVLFCLLAAAVYFVLRWPGFRKWRPAVPLLAALCALSLFALTNKVYLGHLLILDIPLPALLQDAFNPLRSSGRMFWPIAYLAIGWAVLMLDRLPSRRLAGGILLTALVLQLADTSFLRQMLRETYRPKPAPAFDLSPLRQVTALRFVPAYSCTNSDHEAARQIALAVERGGGVVEDGPIGRYDPAICSRSAVERELATSGPRRSDLLALRSLPAAAVEKERQTRQCTAIGQELLCSAFG